MKKIALFSLLFLSQFSQAGTWMTSFDEAKKMALATNKFILVDFWATWCGPCKQMDMDSWNNMEVNQVLDNYIQVKVDIDNNKDIANKYGIQLIPNMYIMDANGKVVYSFEGYHDANALKRELIKFAYSTSFLSNDLINYSKMKNYSTSTRVYMKYLDYSLLVDSEEAKNKLINLSVDYLNDAKKDLSKKDESYDEKKQKLDLLILFELAYEKKYEKVSKKISEMKESDILENNKNYYYFLKYVTAKALNSDDFAAIESKSKEIDGFDFYIDKANHILAKAD
ncbi:MAG TPA: thioredoxin domain-containing protein [Flavobacterium sp.]|uniref:thioredoxin domain-containing protein n=1 Tax=Flavobacterium sp. TaxID=239 RepID=UPI002D1B98E6|nr:thioredoxin domain-containing protein [Flavobacterium sp.]HNP34022.1 thioredoxin domain-containing protein [Flavobacterium sp.]